MPIKMIVTDLDRTLLRADKTVSKFTTDTLNRCREKGIKIVFATARSENSCRRFVEMITPDAIISNGGALVRSQQKEIYRASMNIDTTNRLLMALVNNQSVGCITVDTEKGYFINRLIDVNDPGWIDYFPNAYNDFSNGIDYESYKIAAETSDNKVIYELETGFATVNVIPFTGENWFCIADKSAVKWSGICALSTYMEIDISDIVAFGDDYNDIEMLRGCGIGVAVSNAISEAKDAANHICDTNENDGVAKWLEENVL